MITKEEFLKAIEALKEQGLMRTSKIYVNLW